MGILDRFKKKSFETNSSPEGVVDNSIEKLIFEIAEHQRDSDYHKLYQCLQHKTICLSVDSESVPDTLQDGVPYKTNATDNLRIVTTRISEHEYYVLTVTQPSSSILTDGHATIKWTECLKMILKMDGISGILLQGVHSYVGFDKERIQYILNTYTNT